MAGETNSLQNPPCFDKRQEESEAKEEGLLLEVQHLLQRNSEPGWTTLRFGLDNNFLETRACFLVGIRFYCYSN